MDPRPPKVLRLAKLLRDFNGFAAEHASHQRERGEPVDPLFCSLARGSFLARHKSQPTFDVRLDCCDQGKFDFLGNDACFPEWPSWSIRVCCAHALSVSATLNESGFEALWNQIASTEPIKANPDTKRGFMNAVVVYHKAGTQLTSEIVGAAWTASCRLRAARTGHLVIWHVLKLLFMSFFFGFVLPKVLNPKP